MVRIRLRRVGAKKQPSYRIVVADKERARDGRFIEIIGFYNPRTRPTTIKVKEDRALYWLNVGAQPSNTVERLFREIGTMDRFGRLRSGEEMETLVAEAEAQAAEAEPISPRTRFDAPKQKSEKMADAVDTPETVAAETEANTEEEAEAEAES